MIIARAPLRVSFAGGGTDIPAFYTKYGPGVVVSTAINKYVYVTLSPKFNGKVTVRYSVVENVDTVDEIKHSLIREVLKAYGIKDSIEVAIASDVPARGSGLGASSALTVALCVACEKWIDKNDMRFKTSMCIDEIDSSDRRKLAEKAARIEIDAVGSPIGKQDHYASAVGGLNRHLFKHSEAVESIPYDGELKEDIAAQSMLFYLNIEHKYEDNGSHFVLRILKDQNADIEKNRKVYELQRDNAIEMWDHLTNYENFERFMDHINQNWRLKKTLHGEISNPEIDKFMERAFKGGAIAAKVSGAGGGGFAYLLVPISMQESVREELREFRELKFKFAGGAHIVFDSGERAS